MHYTSDAQNLAIEKIETNYIATDIYWHSHFQNLQQMFAHYAGGTSVCCKYMKVWVQFPELFVLVLDFPNLQRDGCKRIENINLVRYSHIQLHST